MKKLILSMVVCMLGVFMMVGSTWALTMPMEKVVFDIIDWTSLYDNGTPRVSGDTPVVGDESRAILKIRDLYEGSTAGPGIWSYGDDGESLIALESALQISTIKYDYDTGGTYMFFEKQGGGPGDGGLVEMYLGDISDDYLYEELVQNTTTYGPTNWSAIYDHVDDGELFLKMEFVDVDFSITGDFDDDDDSEVYDETALVCIWLNDDLTQGQWVVSDYVDGTGLFRAAYLNIDYANSAFKNFEENFYGTGKDFTITNMGLESELSHTWGSYSDDHAEANVIPEPATMLLLGTGLLCAGFFGRRKNKKNS